MNLRYAAKLILTRIIPIITIVGFIFTSLNFIFDYPLSHVLDKAFPRVDLAYYVLESESQNGKRFPIHLSKDLDVICILVSSIGRSITDDVDVVIENLTRPVAMLKIIHPNFKPHILRDLKTDQQFVEDEQVGKKSVEFRIQRFLPNDVFYVFIGVTGTGGSLFRSDDIGIEDQKGNEARELESIFEVQRKYNYSRITNWTFFIIIIVLAVVVLAIRIIPKPAKGSGKEGKQKE